ncbi:serine/threonine-protein kinase PrkC [bacterium BMS3Abin01]|nr:serine/threonine-protein kinase PrkC [bacterium BMS3Abin01]HDY69640.1 Stk1 family PASTA domain-containing Ser/Thr kinase [Actinomycetota bacterium]
MPDIIDNRYEIIRRLGSGGMADVFLARDTHLGREVAIKILYQRYADDDEFVARFRREAQSAAGLNHPHIVSIYDRGEADGSYYIAMEYLEGRSLKQVISERGTLAPAPAIDISEQILQALQFAHENNVIHRDIKPHNIIINGRDQVKVTDFGIARAGSAARMTETGSIIGTAQYLSPEQAKGLAVEQGSDLYSLGIVLYEMLTGRVPFEGENPVAIALKHLSDVPVPPQALNPEIPDNLNAVVMKALAKDPANRYRHAEEFMADLERCRRDLPVAAALPDDDTARTEIIAPAAAAAAMGAGAAATAASASGDETMIHPGAAGDGKKGRRKIIYFWVILAILAMGAAVAGAYYFAFANQGIAVPDVVGMEQDQARKTLEAEGFRVETAAEEYSDAVEAGKVISQNPAAGRKLKRDGTVSLVISRGSNKVKVPDLVGQSESYAEAKLKEAGLSPDRQPDAYSGSVPKGSVISQDPVAGTEVQTGSTVKYVVSKGAEPPAQVTVPELTGKTVDGARALLAGAGLTLGSVTDDYSGSVPVGQVISQNPVAGQVLDEGSSVSIVVSKGPEIQRVTVPGVVGDTEAAAITSLNTAGLVASSNPVPAPNPADIGNVLSQSPAGGSVVDEGSTVVIDVGT